MHIQVDVTEEFSVLENKVEKIAKDTENNVAGNTNVTISEKKQGSIRLSWIKKYGRRLTKKINCGHNLKTQLTTLNKEKVYKEYQKLRNQVRRSTRKAHKQYEKEIVEHIKENPKKFWSYTQSKLKTKTNIPNLIADDGDGNKITLKKYSDKAEALSNFFSSVFTREPEGDIPALKTRYNKQIIAPKITKDIVQNKLSQLKVLKSPEPDNLHPRILSEMKNTISTPLAKILNTSLDKGKLPLEWKCANIYKKRW